MQKKFFLIKEIIQKIQNEEFVNVIKILKELVSENVADEIKP